LGLRAGEASRLCHKDIDPDNRFLIIRQPKFGKDRLVPFGPKMARAITSFLDGEESRFGPISPRGSMFSFHKKKRIPIVTNTISWAFHKLLRALQLFCLRPAPPHLHCPAIRSPLDLAGLVPGRAIP
jgi:integrase